MARVAADQSVPLPYRLLHELGGVKAFTQEPDVDRMYKTNAGKKDIEGLKGNMRLFMTKYQSDLAAGKTANAKMDMDNYNDAYQDYLKYSQKVLEGLGQ